MISFVQLIRSRRQLFFSIFEELLIKVNKNLFSFRSNRKATINCVVEPDNNSEDIQFKYKLISRQRSCLSCAEKAFDITSLLFSFSAEKMKPIFLWLNNISLITQILGIIPSTILLFDLVNSLGTCDSTYFTINTNNTKCSLSKVGFPIVIAHYACEILFNLILGLIYTAVVHASIDDLCHALCCAVAGIIISPITMIISLGSMIVVVFAPRCLQMDGDHSHFRRFHVAWMGVSDPKLRDSSSLRRLMDVIQVISAIENILEFIIAISLFIARYFNVPLFIFAVCAAIPTLIRSIRLIATVLHALGLHCLDSLSFLCCENEIRSETGPLSRHR